MDFQMRSQGLQGAGWLGAPFGTSYFLGCITIPGDVVRTHPTGPGINCGHIEKQFAALCIVFCGVFESCVPKANLTISGSTLQCCLVERKLSQLRLRIGIYQ